MSTPVPTPNLVCLHRGRWIFVRTLRNCLTLYRCADCGADFEVDSSD